jgi:hypothetical protein
MADEKEQSLDAVMEAAWNETMGEATKEMPIDLSHLSGEPAPAPVEPTPAPVTPPVDTPATEPVEPTAPVVENTQPAEPVVPQHWSETDKATFTKLDKEGQTFLLRRHKEMEADYTRKTQENAETIKLGTAVSRAIDPSIQAELRSTGVTHDQFVENLVAFHRMSKTDPVGLIKHLTGILGVDPVSLAPPMGSTPPQPAIADPIAQRFQALESFVETEQRTRQQAAQESASKTIEQVSTEKNEDGTLVRPHFDKVKTTMARLMSVDPDMDLPTAYDVAVYRDPELRPSLMQRVASPVAATPSTAPVTLDMEKIRKGEQAANAAKNVIRGNGTAAPAPAKPGKMSLADALNSAANEVGLT